MRNMGFRTNTEAILNRTKTVTRRLGWDFLQPGDILQACERCLGLKRGEPIRRLIKIKILSIHSQPLNQISQDDVVKEGYPDWTPDDYVRHFCKVFKVKPDTPINRIEFAYHDD
jgi:hypothetical protein